MLYLKGLWHVCGKWTQEARQARDMVSGKCAGAGGAAGLTLTVANTVFLMEPALNPGLEAQAAARIYRLGEHTLAPPATSVHCALPSVLAHVACALLSILPKAEL